VTGATTYSDTAVVNDTTYGYALVAVDTPATPRGVRRRCPDATT
jgi:hypothetical protein